MQEYLKKDGGYEYLDVGDGNVMILLHGLFGALSNFSDIINAFKDDYRIVVPILPLYKLPLLDTNVKVLAKYTEEFISYKNYDDIILMGNSLGGNVALIYTLNNMKRVKGLVLTGSSGLYENAFGGSFPRREDYNYIRKKTEVTFYDPSMATKELVDEVFEIVNNKLKLARVLSLAKSAIRHNMSSELPKFHLPVSLIWGKNDIVTPPEVAEEFHSLLPNSTLYWIDKCGHAPMMERPEEFNRILRQWLNEKIFI